MGLDYRPRPPLVELDRLDDWQLWSLMRQERARGYGLWIQEDTVLRHVSAELEEARESLEGLTFYGVHSP